MAAYDATHFSPPAPVARVQFINLATRQFVDDVLMLVDTGADASVAPQSVVETLQGDTQDVSLETTSLAGGNRAMAIAHLQMRWLKYTFTGAFLVTDSDYGVIGRNILNQLRIKFDGPAQNWEVM
jgi:hypothetical protein